MKATTIDTKRALLIAACVSTALAGCSTSGSSPQPVSAVNPLSGKLQLAVGTANIFGDMPGAAATGLNVVTTFRQVSGQQSVGLSETLVNTPTLSGPLKLPAVAGTADDYGATIVNGVATSEIGGNAIKATPQQVAGATTIPATTFGVSNGVFSSGIEPFNTTTVGGAGELPATQPVSYVPNVVPAYDPLAATMAGDPNAFVPFGGPPAFDPNGTGRGTRDGQGEPSSLLGTEEGLDVFQGVVPAVGAYTLSVVIPTSQTSNGTLTAPATLHTAALLPAIVPPSAVTTTGAGGLTLPVVLPAGVTEAYVQITDFGPTVTGAVSCNGSAPASAGNPSYYTILATASGTYTLPAAIGPVGVPSSTAPSICTAAQNTTASVAAGSGFTGASDGDAFTVQLVGFDYPAFESSAVKAPNNPSPTITGANGQADITVSSATLFMQAAGSPAVQTLAKLSRADATQRLRGFALQRTRRSHR